jgi:hypothetical protein
MADQVSHKSARGNQLVVGARVVRHIRDRGASDRWMDRHQRALNTRHCHSHLNMVYGSHKELQIRHRPLDHCIRMQVRVALVWSEMGV